jgi:subtilase family serine protease
MVLKNETISAEVILKSQTGRSLTEGTPITSENIKDFKPSQETINEAVEKFRELGFTVLPSNITITIVGTKTLFEKVFGTKLQIKTTTDKRISIRSMEDLTIPDSLRKSIEKVIFIPPPEYF